MSKKDVEFAVAAVCLLIAAIMMAGGWAWTLKAQAGLFGLMLIGLVVCALIALFTSHAAFISNFNHFARRFTGQSDTYHGVITTAQKAGVTTHAGFSFGKTIPIVAILSGWAIYNWFAAFIGGELRQANTIRTANRMAFAGIIGLISIAVFALIFLHTFGQSFLTAANDGGMPAQIASPPFYFVLISASVGNTLLAIFLVVAFIVFWPLITYMAMLQPTRMLFAYSFDGLLPDWVTKVSRNHSPYVAVIITTVASLCVLYWGIHAATFFQVLVYATLTQLVAMMLVGLSAVLLPYVRPALYRSCATTRKLLGVPVLAVAGAASIISGAILYWMFFHYANLGLANKTGFLTFILVTIAAGILFYFLSTAVARRGGRDIAKTYAEIPPE